MPGFKASKDRLALLLGVNRVGNLKLKAVLAYHFENSNFQNIGVHGKCTWSLKCSSEDVQ